MKMRYQTAKVRDRKNVAYIIGCTSDHSDDDILKLASDFYEIEMIAIDRRTNIGK